MASGRDQDGEAGFEEGISRLSSLVLDEVIWEAKVYVKHQQRPEYLNLPKLPLVMQPQLQPSNSSPITHYRRRYSTIWASGGPGMQAFFLESGKKSCGTGVFLPRRGGTELQYNKKPACSPVILPARVVQTLNLNVNELGLHVSRQQDTRSNSKGEYCNSVKHKRAKDVATQRCVFPQNENSSPEIFLPKEWTY